MKNVLSKSKLADHENTMLIWALSKPTNPKAQNRPISNFLPILK